MKQYSNILDTRYLIPDTRHGYIALISAIIISLVLVTVTFILSFTGFFVRSNILDAEYKAQSLALAESCGDVAMLKVAHDIDYNPSNEIVTVGNNTCTIISISPIPARSVGTQLTITTQGVFQKAYTNLQIKITPNSSAISIDSWKEI